MTRINVVPVAELTQPELAGDWKEIFRVFRLVEARVNKGQRPCDVKKPDVYTLGSGHVTFFYDKLGYIRNRIFRLAEEMLNRGYSPNLEMMNDVLDYAELHIPQEWWNDYNPTVEAVEMNIQRMIDNGTRQEVQNGS